MKITSTHSTSTHNPNPRVPPEIEALPEREIVEAYLAAAELADSITRSVDDAAEIANTAYLQVMSTHRWDPAKGSFRTHFLSLVKEVATHARSNRNRKRRAAAEATFHTREELSPYAASPEQVLLARAERREREDNAEDREAKARRMVLELRLRVAHHAVAAAWLEFVNEGGRKPGDLARKLNVTAEQVYAAKKVVEYHAEQIRKEEGWVDE
jgi:DNA-directed RNA polymerase specialized sigma24 family protein